MVGVKARLQRARHTNGATHAIFAASPHKFQAGTIPTRK